MKTLAIATATIGLAVTATPALAQSHEVRSQTVSVAGLDLSTAEGQRMLDRRVQSAAREVCGFNEAPAGTRIRSYSARRCMAQAEANARAQVASIIEDQRRGG